MRPVLKWAGGKTQLLDELRFPETFNGYYEPFIGGGAVLLNKHPEKAAIGDVNMQLINLYRQLSENADAVCDILKTLDSKDCDAGVYKEIRSKYNKKIAGSVNDAECAALMIWLNKHCFNGIYRVNSKGLFNVPYNNKTTGASADYDNLAEVGRYLNSVRINCGDFEATCKDAQAGDFVYFDPPYIPESNNFTAYSAGGFGMQEQERLAAFCGELDKRGVMFMLSNSNTDAARAMYRRYSIRTIDVRRSINRNGKARTGSEIIIKNF